MPIPHSPLPIPGASANHKQRLIEFHRLAGFAEDGDDGAGGVGFDGVEHLHCLDDRQGIADLDLLADGDERRLVRGGRGVERADHRGAQHVAFRQCGGLLGAAGGGFGRRLHRHGGRGGRRLGGGGWRVLLLHRRAQHGRALGHARQAHAFFAFLDLDFGEIGFFEQVDQFLDFAEIHKGLWK
ncbi:hypothetical protein XAC2852_140024 [Xanthomonas citri pv. citri]|nr:hypothetical protein XAC2852_140024 [Xanthomonas citri pv. citri]